MKGILKRLGVVLSIAIGIPTIIYGYIKLSLIIGQFISPDWNWLWYAFCIMGGLFYILFGIGLSFYGIGALIGWIITGDWDICFDFLFRCGKWEKKIKEPDKDLLEAQKMLNEEFPGMDR